MLKTLDNKPLMLRISYGTNCLDFKSKKSVKNRKR